MKIIQWPGPPPAVVRISVHGDVLVAVPPRWPVGRTLDLARLVLSGAEFEQFAAQLRPGADGGDGGDGGARGVGESPADLATSE